MKALYWIKRNGLVIICLSFVAWCMYAIINGASSLETKMWLQMPLSDLRIQDILIIVVIHAWISRSDNKCNCKQQ